MKKLILLVIILISTISIKAEVFYYTTSAIAIDNLDGNGFGKWKQCNVDITINFETEQIIIYSSEIQIMDIESSYNIEYKDYTMVGLYINDTQYNKCLLKLFIYDSGSLYVKLEYNNIQYKYKINKI